MIANFPHVDELRGVTQQDLILISQLTKKYMEFTGVNVILNSVNIEALH